MSRPIAPMLLLVSHLVLGCADGDQRAGGYGNDGQGTVAATGEAAPGAAGEPPPWLRAREDCPAQPVSIYLTGNIRDMQTGEAVCTRTILVCSDSLTSEVVYNSGTGKCPWAEGSRAALASREDGAPVCCTDWERAKVTKDPCDPLADADCDGLPNDDDAETLLAASAGG